MHNDIEPTDLGLKCMDECGTLVIHATYKSEFGFFNACSMNLFPDPSQRRGKSGSTAFRTDFLLSIPGFPRTLNCRLILTQVDKGGSKSCPVRDAGEE